MASFLRNAAAALLASCSLAGWLSAVQGKEPADYADPLIDSANSRWIFFSSACRPFAMVNLSPDTNARRGLEFQLLLPQRLALRIQPRARLAIGRSFGDAGCRRGRSDGGARRLSLAVSPRR